jgi:MFS family permease
MVIQKTLNRDFMLSFFAQLVFSSVFCILVPTIPIYLSKFQARESEIGFIIGIFSISSLILRPFVGRGLLTIPEKKFMIGGALIYVVSCLAYLIAPPFWPLLIVRFFHGIGMALFSTASFTLAANIIPQKHRGQLMSYFSLSTNLSWALGPLFGMLIINHFNFNTLFLVCTGLSLSSFYISTRFNNREMIPVKDQPSNFNSFFSREALPASIIAFLINVIWGTLVAFFPLYALRHGVSNPGIYFVFLAFTISFGRILGSRLIDRFGNERMIIPCLAIIILGIAVLSYSATLPMFILSAIILGTGWALIYPSLLVHAIENAGSARGPEMGTFTALADLGAGIGPMIMGVILELTSYPIMYFSLILSGIVGILYFYYMVARREDETKLVAERSQIPCKH